MQKSIRSNTISRFILDFFRICIPLIMGPYLARTLDVYLYGEYNKAISILGWFLAFASFGVYNYGMRTISQNRKDPEKIEEIFTTIFVIGIITSLITWVSYIVYIFVVPQRMMIEIYLLLSIQIIANIFMVEWVNEAFEEYKFITVKNIILKSMLLMLILFAVKETDDILRYTAIGTGIVLVNNIISYIYIRHKIKLVKINWTSMRKLINPLFIVFLLMNADMLYTRLDRLFLSVFAEGIQVSHYIFGQDILGVIMGLIQGIIMVTLPRLATYYSEQRHVEYTDLLNTSSRLFFMASLPMAMGIAVLSKEIMFIYAGPKYLGASLTMRLFGIRYIIRVLDIVLANQVIFIAGKEKSLTKIYFCGGAINIVLNILLVARGILGAETAVMTTMIAECAVIGLQLKCIRREINREIEIINCYFLKYVMIASSFWGIIYILKQLIPYTYNFSIQFIAFVLSTIGACSIVYVAILVITKDKYLNIVVKNIYNIIKNLKLYKKNTK